MEMLTIDEYANLMRVHIGSVRRLCCKGEIPGATKVGGRWRIPYEPPVQQTVEESPAEQPASKTQAPRNFAFEAAAYNLAVTLRQAMNMVESAIAEYKAALDDA